MRDLQAVFGESPNPLVRMGLSAAGLFLFFKLLSQPSRFALAYTLLWPGMNPKPFEIDGRPEPWSFGLIATALGKMILGAALLLIPIEQPLARAWLAAGAGLLIVHLGLFDLLTCAWRRLGFPVERICPDPWQSQSVSEFWGRRWNMAFHAFVRSRVYRPLASRFGAGLAIIAVFLFSGIMHEFVISFPAGGGWGLPTIYFAIHGGLVLLEKRGLLKSSRFTTALFVLLPLPLLFHPAFLLRVMP